MKREGWSDYKAGTEMFNLSNISFAEKPLVGGLYQHFKGGIYLVLGFAIDEEDIERELVIYKSIVDGKQWAREVSVFMSEVDAEKYPEFAGKKRLQYIGSI